MNKKYILTREEAKQFSKELVEFKSSLKSLDTIAGNLIPQDIFGREFKDYLTEMCNRYGEEYSIRIRLNFMGDFQHLNDELRRKTYLLIRLLLSFFITNTKPAYIEFLVICNDNSVSIQVKDDGKKYDTPVLSYPGIHASENIKDLTEAMNGFFIILGGKKKGNTIEVTIKN